MTLPGETISTGSSIICDCGCKVSNLQVCHSGAGFYIGTYCPECGPYSRESIDYYHTEVICAKQLKDKTWRPRNSDFNG